MRVTRTLPYIHHSHTTVSYSTLTYIRAHTSVSYTPLYTSFTHKCLVHSHIFELTYIRAHTSVLYTHLSHTTYRDTPSGYFSIARFSCSHMVVKTILYCTRKCDSCKAGCMSASCLLQPPRNGSTCEVPVLEHETVSRILLNFLKDSPRKTFYMHEVFLGQSKRKFHVPGR